MLLDWTYIDHRQALMWKVETDFTMSIEELIICAVLRVPGDALHPPLGDVLVGGTSCQHPEGRSLSDASVSG